MRKTATAALAALAVLAGCGSPSGPPNTRNLLHQIPDCSHFAASIPDVLARQDVSCITSDGTAVNLATFGSATSEQRWIRKWGVWAACCLQGDLWAATVDSSHLPAERDWQHVQKYLGGRQVKNLGA